MVEVQDVKLALAFVVVLSGCGFTPPADSVLLPIPDRPWAPEAPIEGWCGEVSIQTALLQHGAWASQRHIHDVTKPAHVDLWETDMPPTMTAMGLTFETWKGNDEHDYLRWIIGHVRAGRMVIVGVKLVPDLNAKHDLDHLMPIVGFSPKGLVFNTNLENGQMLVPFTAMEKGVGVKLSTGAAKKQFGWAIKGGPGKGPLRVLKETATTVTLASDAGTFEVLAAEPFTAR